MLISAKSAPAIGDVHAAGARTIIWLAADARQRADWGRYLNALTVAISRGACVIWTAPPVGAKPDAL